VNTKEVGRLIEGKNESVHGKGGVPRGLPEK
jgi:hypothetical protein